MTDNLILKSNVRAAIWDVTSLSDWNDVRDGSTKEVVAQWTVILPYTGPSKDSQTDEWVHYRNGTLKIRYRADALSPNLSDFELETMSASEVYAIRHSLPEPKVYGVRYVVLASTFQSASSLHGFIANRVTEFIEHRDRYLMVGNRYNVNPSNKKKA